MEEEMIEDSEMESCATGSPALLSGLSMLMHCNDKSLDQILNDGSQKTYNYMSPEIPLMLSQVVITEEKQTGSFEDSDETRISETMEMKPDSTRASQNNLVTNSPDFSLASDETRCDQNFLISQITRNLEENDSDIDKASEVSSVLISGKDFTRKSQKKKTLPYVDYSMNNNTSNSDESTAIIPLVTKETTNEPQATQPGSNEDSQETVYLSMNPYKSNICQDVSGTHHSQLHSIRKSPSQAHTSNIRKQVRFESPIMTYDDLGDLQSDITHGTSDVEAVPGSPSSIISFQDWPKRVSTKRKKTNGSVNERRQKNNSRDSTLLTLTIQDVQDEHEADMKTLNKIEKQQLKAQALISGGQSIMTDKAKQILQEANTSLQDLKQKYKKSMDFLSAQMSKSIKPNSFSSKITKENMQLLIQRQKRLVSLIQMQVRLLETIRATEKSKQGERKIDLTNENKEEESADISSILQEVKINDNRRKQDVKLKGVIRNEEKSTHNMENKSKLTGGLKTNNTDKNIRANSSKAETVTCNKSANPPIVLKINRYIKETPESSQSQKMTTVIKVPVPMWEKLKSRDEGEIRSVLNIPGVKSKPPNKIAIGNQQSDSEKVKLSELLHNAEFVLNSPVQKKNTTLQGAKEVTQVKQLAETVVDLTKESDYQPDAMETPEDPLVDFLHQQSMECDKMLNDYDMDRRVIQQNANGINMDYSPEVVKPAKRVRSSWFSPTSTISTSDTVFRNAPRLQGAADIAKVFKQARDIARAEKTIENQQKLKSFVTPKPRINTAIDDNNMVNKNDVKSSNSHQFSNMGKMMSNSCTSTTTKPARTPFIIPRIPQKVFINATDSLNISREVSSDQDCSNVTSLLNGVKELLPPTLPSEIYGPANCSLRAAELMGPPPLTPEDISPTEGLPLIEHETHLTRNQAECLPENEMPRNSPDDLDINSMISNVKRVRFPTPEERIPWSLFLTEDFWTTKDEVVIPKIMLDALDNW